MNTDQCNVEYSALCAVQRFGLPTSRNLHPIFIIYWKCAREVKRGYLSKNSMGGVDFLDHLTHAEGSMDGTRQTWLEWRE